MAVFTNLAVGLRMNVRRRYENAEVAVLEAGDEAAHVPNANAVVRRVALRFKSEFDADRIADWS
nr:hypothetical protein [Intrasporangium flavum]